MTEVLPAFVEPMLATPGEPFDSPDFLFEIKWDGYRAIVRRDATGCRLWSRNRNDLTDQFPELLSSAASLPVGSILDGEIVILRDGVPDFGALQRRRRAGKQGGAILVLFDLLYFDGRSIMDQPLVERRQQLEQLVRSLPTTRLQFSDGIAGAGLEFYRQAGLRGLEGITAKRLDSRYLPGRRTDAWFKIKHRRQIECAVVGYLAAEGGAVRSLAVAADRGDGLVYVGQVGSGLGQGDLRRLRSVLSARRIPKAIVPCPPDVLGVSPGIYCVVSYLEFTDDGMLRAPVCESWVSEDDD